MNQEPMYTLDEAHIQFAKQTNGHVWELLGKAERSPAEDDEMPEAAYASLYHWRIAGGEVNRQRGEWLIGRVFCVLGEAKPALKHAKLCLDLTDQFRGQMKDFDIAYAYEGMARALALNDDLEGSRKYLAMAQEAGEQISDSEDQEIFSADFHGGDWYGAR